ncbi:hypothetical protein KP77_05220 [Jeotgalibacillus alimentarius]|uniref:Gluconokinase n=1 Tax=Jeotgalibacillus alimentarius TaxID=135826 RepID=A0A0C2WAF6_9BACL|nr:hypothetical protein KP77_05220 [Jeotgalibacillus alimentarius]
MNIIQRIYIISGPAGVGKSTTSKMLAESFEHSAYIEGDVINHMVVGGYLPPWESEASLELVWKNIADLSINFIEAGKNVVIDYVAFPEEVELFSQRVSSQMPDLEIMYVVLWADRDELLKRDAERIKDHQMGGRCLELVQEFEEKGLKQRYLYDTTHTELSNLDQIMKEIKSNSAFVYLSLL